MLVLDHVAVAGETLEEAAAAVEDALGVRMQPGGQHRQFGTHNRLLGLENGLYLEAIAIDPEAPPLGRPRWFGLDRFEGAARLTNWICRCTDLEAALSVLPPGAGKPVALSRGELRWRMAVPDTGMLPFDNLFPAVIEWQTPRHPSSMLARSGCALRRLVVAHPEAAVLRRHLGELDGPVVFEAGPPALRAELDTPNGLRVLE